MFSNADQLTSPKMCELITKIQQEHPMIVAICEVKPKNAAKERSEQDYKIRDYSLHPVNLTNDQGRGIAVYTHSSLDKSIVQINSDMNFEEACLLEVRLRGGDIMLFACCYRSPTHTHSSEENNEKLNRLFHAISLKKYSHRCIVGDFNYRNINWVTWTTNHGEDSTEAKFIETTRNCYFYQHIEQVTRRRGNDNPSLIDLVFTDEEMQISDIQHLSPLGKSDHSVITLTFNCYLDYSKPKERYLYNKGDYDEMKKHLASSHWAQEYSVLVKTADVEVMWTSLKSKLLGLRDKYVPQQL